MIFIYNFIKNRRLNKLRQAIESEILDIFLITLLKLMKVMFVIDKGFRKNIEGFRGVYSFMSRDGKIAASAVFKNGKMKVRRKAEEKNNIKVIFRDGDSLKKLIFNENPDIIGSILDNEVSYSGNLNYLAKFAYMAKHLQLMFSL